VSSTSYVGLVSLACVVMFGLGFFTRPSRATATWSLGFALAMLASYATLSAELVESAQLRALGMGLFLPANAIIWVGLRHESGRGRSHWEWAAAYTIASPAVLLATVQTEAYSVAFRLDFAVCAVFSVLMIVELLRLYPRFREEVLPLGFAAALFPAFALFTLIDGVTRLLSGTASADDLELVRKVNSAGTAIYAVCALVTLVLIARRPRTAATETASDFENVARRRLERAASFGDESWSLVDIRLDSPNDLRTAFGETVYESVNERFRTQVLASMPADADLDVRDDRVVALIPRPRDSVRQLLVELLELIAQPDPQSPLPVRVSASIGWAPVASVGYDLAELLHSAATAQAAAQDKGGDRWERIVTDHGDPTTESSREPGRVRPVPPREGERA
jgi:hypothetical protein